MTVMNDASGVMRTANLRRAAVRASCWRRADARRIRSWMSQVDCLSTKK